MHASGCSTYQCGRKKEHYAWSIMHGAFSRFLFPPFPTLCFPPVIGVTGACLLWGMEGSWLGYQVLPAIGTVSILELAATSGSSRMSPAPNLHIATQLFTIKKYLGHNTSIGVDSGISLSTTIQRFTFGRTFSPESSTWRLGDSGTNITKKRFATTCFSNEGEDSWQPFMIKIQL